MIPNSKEVRNGETPTEDDLLREFHRGNFHHVNDTIHRMGISQFSATYCGTVVEKIIELQKARAQNKKLRAALEEIKDVSEHSATMGNKMGTNWCVGQFDYFVEQALQALSEIGEEA